QHQPADARMTISSRTPEGLPQRCPLCGADIRLEPSEPIGDAPCPHCGCLVLFGNPSALHGSSGALTGGGGYRWLKRVRSREFGETWQAEAPGRIPVAIEVMHRPLEPEAAQRELRALERIQRLSHPFLLQTHASWREQDRLVIVMELAEGSLRDRLNECRKEG